MVKKKKLKNVHLKEKKYVVMNLQLENVHLLNLEIYVKENNVASSDIQEMIN